MSQISRKVSAPKTRANTASTPNSTSPQGSKAKQPPPKDSVGKGLTANDVGHSQTLKNAKNMSMMLGSRNSDSVANMPATTSATLADTVKDRLGQSRNPVAKFLGTAPDQLSGLKDRLIPFGMGEKKSLNLGSYTAAFKGADASFSPTLSDGLGFKGKAELLRLDFSKETQLNDNWSSTQGGQFRIKSRFGSGREHKLDAEAGVFREFRGQFGDDYKGTFRFGAGLRQRIDGPDDGLRAGVSLNQEAEGGQFNLLGKKMKLYGRGEQNLYHNFDSGETDFNYEFMAGPKADFNLNLRGHDFPFSAAVGPQISGGSDRDEKLELGTRFELKF